MGRFSWKKLGLFGSKDNSNRTLDSDDVSTKGGDSTIVSDKPENVIFVEQWYKDINTIGFQRCLHHFHEKAEIIFKDAPMNVEDFATEGRKMTDAFPDFQLILGPCKETEPGTVVIDVRATGTHTGKPYGFGPFPPVDITGIKVVLDVERTTFTIVDGKIMRLFVESMGEKTGPPGFYSSIGGFPI